MSNALGNKNLVGLFVFLSFYCNPTASLTSKSIRKRAEELAYFQAACRSGQALSSEVLRHFQINNLSTV